MKKQAKLKDVKLMIFSWFIFLASYGPNTADRLEKSNLGYEYWLGCTFTLQKEYLEKCIKYRTKMQ